MYNKEDIEIMKMYDLSKNKEYTHLIIRLINVDNIDLFDAQQLSFRLDEMNILSQDVDFLPYEEIVKLTIQNKKKE